MAGQNHKTGRRDQRRKCRNRNPREYERQQPAILVSALCQSCDTCLGSLPSVIFRSFSFEMFGGFQTLDSPIGIQINYGVPSYEKAYVMPGFLSRVLFG